MFVCVAGVSSASNLKCLLPQSAEIKCGDQFKFLILMMPTDTSVPFFIQELNKHNCKCVVRVCESRYSLEPFKQANIQASHYYSYTLTEASICLCLGLFKSYERCVLLIFFLQEISLKICSRAISLVKRKANFTIEQQKCKGDDKLD